MVNAGVFQVAKTRIDLEIAEQNKQLDLAIEVLKQMMAGEGRSGNFVLAVQKECVQAVEKRAAIIWTILNKSIQAAAIVSLVGCAAHSHTGYDLTSARADKNKVYLSYRKTSNLEMGTILNVHGGMYFYRESDFYKKLDKSSLKDGDEIDLLQGESFSAPSRHLVYEDDDFLVKDAFFQPSNVHDVKVTVTTRDMKYTVVCKQLPDALHSERPEPVRVDDKLILCGKIVPATGKPEDGTAVLFDHRYDRGVAHDGAIYFLNPPRRGQMYLAEGPIELTKVDAHSFQPMGTVTLPFLWENAGVIGRFRHGFIIRGNHSMLYACAGPKCRKFTGKFFSDAILVEDSGDALILFTKEIGDSDHPVVRVSFIRAEPE